MALPVVHIEGDNRRRHIPLAMSEVTFNILSGVLGNTGFSTSPAPFEVFWPPPAL